MGRHASAGWAVVFTVIFGLASLVGPPEARAQGLAAAPVNSPQQLPATTSENSAPRPVPHLVRVNVVVRDQAGNPINGLTRDDFIL
jgi:hypothetical protein